MTHEEALSKLEIEEGATSSEINAQYQEFYNEFQMRITNAPTEHQRKLYQKKLEELTQAFEILSGDSLESNTQELPGIAESDIVETEKAIDQTVSHPIEMSKEKALQFLGLGEKFTSKELENAFKSKVSSCETGRDNAISTSIRNAYEEAIIECNYAHQLLKEYIFIAPPIVKVEKPTPKVSKNSSTSKKKWLLPISILSGVIILIILFFVFGNGSSSTNEPINPANHDEYVSLKSQADLLAKQGNWQEALTNYKKAYSLVETSEVKDSLTSMKNHLLLASIKKDDVVDVQKEQVNMEQEKEVKEITLNKPETISKLKAPSEIKKEVEAVVSPKKPIDENWKKKYDYVSKLYDGWYYFVKLNGKNGIANQNGEIVVPLLYDLLQQFSEGLACASIGDPRGSGKTGFVNKSGEVVIPFIYKDATSFDGGLAVVSQGGKYGFINKKGEVVIPFKFEEFGGFRDGLALVNINDKYGFVNKKGEVIIPIKYSWGVDFRNGIASVGGIGGKTVEFDKNGSCVEGCNYKF